MKDTLFIIDLDGVVFDSSKRFNKAMKPDENTNWGIDWNIAFDPDNLSLDTLIDDAQERIDILSTRGDIVYLTSRPESMYEASKARLAEFGLGGYELICKPKCEQYTKTKTWKAAFVEGMALKLDSIIFIDDEEINRNAVEDLGLSNVFCRKSLADAVRSEIFMMYEKLSNERSEIALYPHLPCTDCSTATYRGILQYNRGEWFVVARCTICDDKRQGLQEPPRARESDGPALIL